LRVREIGRCPAVQAPELEKLVGVKLPQTAPPGACEEQLQAFPRFASPLYELALIHGC
jgi:hypothetical protein